jgi:hypothetical protein
MSNPSFQRFSFTKSDYFLKFQRSKKALVNLGDLHRRSNLSAVRMRPLSKDPASFIKS